MKAPGLPPSLVGVNTSVSSVRVSKNKKWKDGSFQLEVLSFLQEGEIYPLKYQGFWHLRKKKKPMFASEKRIERGLGKERDNPKKLRTILRRQDDSSLGWCVAQALKVLVSGYYAFRKRDGKEHRGKSRKNYGNQKGYTSNENQIAKPCANWVLKSRGMLPKVSQS